MFRLMTKWKHYVLFSCLLLTAAVVLNITDQHSYASRVTNIFKGASGIPLYLSGQNNPQVVNPTYNMETKDNSHTTDFDKTLTVDDSTAAENISKRIRLACFVTSREVNMETKLTAVNQTWGRRCDKILYVMTSNKTAPDILGVTITDKHGTLTEKIRTAFTHMRKHYLDRFDWFLKADDDTYVIVENLKYLLSHFNPNIGIVVGDHFKPYSVTGYMAGGAGYVLSKEALRRLVDNGYSVSGRCRHAGGSEDIETGRCLDKVGVTKYLSLDKYNRSTFHGNNPESFLVDKPNFVFGYRVHKTIHGLECCSQLPISFHYISPQNMILMEYLVYRVNVIGRSRPYRNLNDMFTARESQIPRDMGRAPYPGETLEEYEHFAEWRRQNTTIYIPEKKNL